jgi:hypothetical protein
LCASQKLATEAEETIGTTWRQRDDGRKRYLCTVL